MERKPVFCVLEDIQGILEVYVIMRILEPNQVRLGTACQ